jgi:hopanoid biosynthesis associated RND transporter like protein HpnN
MNPKEFSQSLTARFLGRLAAAVFVHPRWFFWPQWALMALAIAYTATSLQFITSRDALVGAEKEYHRLFLNYRKEFPVQDNLVVVVESENLERNRQFVERLGAKLRDQTNLFSTIFFKTDLDSLGRKPLLFLPQDALVQLHDTLKDFRPVLLEFAKANNLATLFDTVNTQFRTALSRPSSEGEALVGALPALERIVTQATDSLSRLGSPPSPGVMSLFEEGAEAERQMYLTSDNGRVFLLMAQPRNEDLTGDAVQRMRQLLAQTQAEVPGANVGLTGGPVLEVDEMAQSQRDTTIATIVSLVLVALIFIYGYNETGRPLKATLVLLVGLAYTMGYTTLTVHHLNILTITFLPMLIGLAIDFGVHLITRYEEELRHGRSEKDAMEISMVNTGLGIFTGAFTTAGAFFAMGLSDFKGVKEMGIICGGGMLVCLAAMMTLLPVLLLRGRQNVLDHDQGEALAHRSHEESDRRARLENTWLQRPKTVLAITFALTALALVPIRRVGFDYNLLHMQTDGLPAVLFQDKLIQSSTRSVLFGVAIADSVPAANRLVQAFTNLPSVAAVDTMTIYLGKEQSQELGLLREVKNLIADVRFAPVDTRPVDIKTLELSLYSLDGYLGLAAPQAKTEATNIYPKILSLRAATSDLLRHLWTGNPAEMAEKLADFQHALFTDVHRTFKAIQDQDVSGPMQVEDLPEPLRQRFVGISGKFLIQIYPKKDVWDRRNQEEFVRELRTVDPHVTGDPVQLLEYTTLLKNSYVQAAWYALTAIAILVFIHFRKISCVVLALLPVAIGGVWMVGLMGAFGIPFNPANIMTLPLIIGIGVTNGIHILNRFAEEQHPSILARSTGKAVLVSGLTTIAGFGSLILAQHRGIRSLGLIMAVGVTTCMVVGLTFLPALLNLLLRAGWKIKTTQRDNARSTLGREEPR